MLWVKRGLTVLVVNYKKSVTCNQESAQPCMSRATCHLRSWLYFVFAALPTSSITVLIFQTSTAIEFPLVWPNIFFRIEHGFTSLSINDRTTWTRHSPELVLGSYHHAHLDSPENRVSFCTPSYLQGSGCTTFKVHSAFRPPVRPSLAFPRSSRSLCVRHRLAEVGLGVHIDNTLSGSRSM